MFRWTAGVSLVLIFPLGCSSQTSAGGSGDPGAACAYSSGAGPFAGQWQRTTDNLLVVFQQRGSTLSGNTLNTPAPQLSACAGRISYHEEHCTVETMPSP